MRGASIFLGHCRPRHDRETTEGHLGGRMTSWARSPIVKLYSHCSVPQHIPCAGPRRNEFVSYENNLISFVNAR